MRKPVLPRVLILLVVYFGVFVALVAIQFTKQQTFSRRIGNFVVSGQYRTPDDDDSALPPNEHFLEGDVHILFGGIDFCIGKGSEAYPFSFAGEDGRTEEALPAHMIVLENSIRFTFPEGMTLEFIGQSSGSGQEMRINGVFPENVSHMELPFKLQRRTGIQYNANDQFIVQSGGIDYTFGNSPIDTRRRVLLIEAGGRPVTYRAVPIRKTASPEDFIISEAASDEAYNEAVNRWRDENYSVWSRIVSSQDNEDLVIALIGEAFSRGNYSAAVASVPQAFLGGASRTYESSVYFGNLDQAYPMLIAAEMEKLSRLSEQINEKSLGFLLEPEVFEYLAIRGHDNLIDAGADLVRTIDPDILAPDIIPGILEGFTIWTALRPETQNPFERLTDKACLDITESLRSTNDGWVFVFFGMQVDMEFNLRLGKALLAYAETVQNDTWEGIGRSLILSALYAARENDNSPSSQALTNAKLYRILCPVDTYPRTLPISAAANNVWTWTTAQAVSTTMRNDILDISVTFPAGETHYMLIRGIQPFSRVQLYNMNYRSDSQFERYESSGWIYNSREETMLLKMRHRETIEHIQIIIREPPPPPPPPPVVEPEPEIQSNENDEVIITTIYGFSGH